MGVDSADPKLYRSLSVPFESADSANDALKAFYEDVLTARIKHKIPDVLVVAQISIEDSECEAMSSWSCGDVMKTECMASWALGRYSSEREQRTLQAMKSARKSK